MKNLPEKIYLQIVDDSVSQDELSNMDFNEIVRLGGVTWCQDRINQTDLEFVISKNIDDKG